MPFVSYAQNYEDVMLWRALHDVEKGSYVDVGAADPKADSVTCAFYERGWSGINIEPLDEYFDNLRQARTRDTNLKVAVGKEPAVRTFYSFPGTGLSTFDPETSAKQQQAGFAAKEVVVPVLTLNKVLEDCGMPTIHFLKIDVEGEEAGVLEGLDLERFRPWIIVVEATEPNSTTSSRDNWEHLITAHRYGFAYFDGLNCFYVADEVSELKNRLTVPPNVFDDFLRWREWHLANHVVDLEKRLEREHSLTVNQQVALEAEKNQSTHLRSALTAEQAQTANLRNALAAEQAQMLNLRGALAAEKAALAREQAQNTNLQNALLVRLDYLSSRIENVRAQLGFPWVDRAMGRTFSGLQNTGNRLTGGGIRAAVKRLLKAVIPTKRAATSNLLPITNHQSPITSQPPPPEGELHPPETGALACEGSPPPPSGQPAPPEDPIAAAVPASARSAYLQLKTAMSREDAWHQDS